MEALRKRLGKYTFRIDDDVIASFEKLCKAQGLAGAGKAYRDYTYWSLAHQSDFKTDLELSPEMIGIANLYTSISTLRLVYSLTESNAAIIRMLATTNGRSEATEKMDQRLAELRSHMDSELSAANELMTLLERKMTKFRLIVHESEEKGRC